MDTIRINLGGYDDKKNHGTVRACVLFLHK
jgi:hypothetical protein